MSAALDQVVAGVLLAALAYQAVTLAWIAATLRTIARRQDRIMARLGVVEKSSGIVPPPNDSSGPHPVIRNQQ